MATDTELKTEPKATMVTTIDQWWGYSNAHGWVMLDRSVACNKPAQDCPLLFVRCSDGVVFSELRERWDAPHYVYAPQYLKALPSNQRELAEATLANFQRHSKEYRSNVASEGDTIDARRFEQTRRTYFAELGRVDPGCRRTSAKTHRVTHCYRDKLSLDSEVSLECKSCRWLVCHRCGACRCGWNGTY